MERILTTKQMSLCEKESDRIGASLAQLMDNAGKKLADLIISEALKGMHKSCVMLCGKGNNGGDGFVATDILSKSGISVTVILCCGEPSTDLSKAAFNKLSADIKVFHSANDEAFDVIKNAEILCDCIFGTGFKGSLRENILPIFEAAEKCSGIKVACDLPSGSNAVDGTVDKLTFKADTTLTFHRKKVGLLLSPARFYAGKILTADIDISENCEATLDYEVSLCDDSYAKSLLPKRPENAHKGTFGTLTAVCGSENYIGAAKISAEAALRSGLGICRLCTADKVITAISGSLPECVYAKMKCDENGFLTSENADEILKYAEKSKCILIGCGLGHTAETEKLVAKIIENSPCPVICDADGINSLCANIDVLFRKKSEVILTPHPAELGRLCGNEIPADRLSAARELCEKYGVTVLAKSAESFVVSKEKAVLMRYGNTALSKGGSGDMLAGLTASFVTQGADCFSACMLACFIMGKSAEMLSEKYSERGILAEDIIHNLPSTFKSEE